MNETSTSSKDLTSAWLDRWARCAKQHFFLLLALLIISCAFLAISREIDTDKDSSYKIPRKYPLVPGVLHVAALWLKGPQYFTHMVSAPASPICYVNILGRRVIVAHPSLDHDIAKHAREISLTHFAASTLGKRVFELTDHTEHGVMHLDTRSMYQSAFAGPELARLSNTSFRWIESRLQNLEHGEVVDLSRWLFRFTAGAVAVALWDADSPWNTSEQAMDDLMTFASSFHTLYLPFPSLTARTATTVRARLIRILSAHRQQQQQQQQQSSSSSSSPPFDPIAHRFNVIPHLDPTDWASNASYYGLEILTALALLGSIANIVVFLVRHVLADRALHATILAEIEALRVAGRRASRPSSLGEQRGDDGEGDDETVVLDLAALPATCPHLLAAWHETLRLHATLVPRQASSAFVLGAGRSEGGGEEGGGGGGSGGGIGGGWAVRARDIILLPMTSTNQDAAVWGPDRDVFRPGRMLVADDDGGGGKTRVDGRLARRVRGFGVAGNLCPGRHYGFATAMAAAVGVLAGVEMERVGGGGGGGGSSSASGEGWPEPRPAMGFTAGVQRFGADVKARVGRLRGKGRVSIVNSGSLNQY